MKSSPGTDNSRSSTPVSIEPEVFNHCPIYATIPPYILPAADRPATGLDNPAEYHDFGDRGRLLSCDSIESVVETRPERHLRWLQEANSDPCAGVSNEIDDLDQDILQPPRSQILAVAHANQQAFQRAYIEESGVTSDTAISILG